MKRISLTFIILLLIMGCSNNSTDKNDIAEDKEPAKAEEEQEYESEKEDVEEIIDTKEEVEEENESEIDTSMYEYSKGVEVTDAIEINEYVSIIIKMNESLKPGLAFQHATNQTYEFLQQDALEGAERVGINITLNDQKIAMYEVTLSDFKTKDDEPMAQLVLDAAVMEMIIPEVEEYAKVMELSYKEK